MKIDFQPAFAVDIKHDYYPDGISADFMLAPTPDCQQQLRRFGLLFKETAGGFIVLYETTGTDGPVEPKRRIEGPLALSFVLWAKSPYLLNYSNLPLSKTPEQIFYLSNRHQVLNNAQLLLSADPVGEFVSAADLLPLRPQRFQVDVATDKGSLLWELFDAQGGLVHRQRVISVEGNSSYLVDLGNRPPGFYLLRRDSAEQLRFYAADRLVSGYPFGLLEIAVDPNVADAFSFVTAGGDVQFRRYLVKLQARKTTWEYFVVAKYEAELKPTDLSLTLDDPPVTFTRQPAVTLADGSTAIPFIAGTPLPLRQQPIKGIALSKKKGASTPKLDIESLPNPAVTEVIPALAGKVISRVYVYL
ncbi:MAG TPA: hypothetical protein VIR78_14390 [Malonomonas sp.]